MAGAALIAVVGVAFASPLLDLDHWEFLACGAQNVPLDALAEKGAGWVAVRLPHRDYGDLQGEVVRNALGENLPPEIAGVSYGPGGSDDSTFGWYRARFVVPASLRGVPLVLRLGIVDDADRTYVNRRLVGSRGVFPPDYQSAYSELREHFIPGDCLRPGEENELLINVYNGIGSGGLLSSPVLLVPLRSDGRWQFRPLRDAENISPATLNRLGDWQEVACPDPSWDERLPSDPALGCYRVKFTVPRALAAEGLALDLGPVLDADEVWLNGSLIGRTGSLPPRARAAVGKPRVYQVPHELLRDENELHVIVYNERGPGGVRMTPGLRVLPQKGTLQAPTGRTALEQLEQQVVRDARDGKHAAAVAGFRTVLAAQGFSPSIETIQALMDIQASAPFSRDAFVLTAEHGIGGEWYGWRGNDGFVLAAGGGDCDVVGKPGQYWYSNPLVGQPRLAPDVPVRYDATLARELGRCYSWVQAVETDDPRALYHPLTAKPFLGWWDDGGETHPFDNEGPDLTISLELSDGLWRVSLYLIDYDWGATATPRQHGVVLAEAGGQPLAVADTGRFADGLWLAFVIRGPRRVCFRIIKGWTIGAVASFLGLDRVHPPLKLHMAGLPASVLPDRFREWYEELTHGGDRLTRMLRSGEARRLIPDLRRAAEQPDGIGSGTRVGLAFVLWQVGQLCGDVAAAKQGLSVFLDEIAESNSPDNVVETLSRLRQQCASRGWIGACQLLDDCRTRMVLSPRKALTAEALQTVWHAYVEWAPVAPRFSEQLFGRLLDALGQAEPAIALGALNRFGVEALELERRGEVLGPKPTGRRLPLVAAHPRLAPLLDYYRLSPASEQFWETAQKFPPESIRARCAEFLRAHVEARRIAIMQTHGQAAGAPGGPLEALLSETCDDPEAAAGVWFDLVTSNVLAGNFDRALTCFRRLGDLGRGGRWLVSAACFIAEHLATAGRLAEAAKLLREGLAQRGDAEPNLVGYAEQMLRDIEGLLATGSDPGGE